jgi:8-oxo-dGTP pyrophosphatase MutT (NUDIX family)
VSRRAAVALLVRLDETRVPAVPQLLMIKRATFEGDPWSGHIALPGGRREPADATLERTVVRETWEETAIDLERDGRASMSSLRARRGCLRSSSHPS